MKIEWSPEAAASRILRLLIALRVLCTILPPRSRHFPIVGGRAELLALANSCWRRFHLSSSIGSSGTL